MEETNQDPQDQSPEENGAAVPDTNIDMMKDDSNDSSSPSKGGVTMKQDPDNSSTSTGVKKKDEGQSNDTAMKESGNDESVQQKPAADEKDCEMKDSSKQGAQEETAPSMSKKEQDLATATSASAATEGERSTWDYSNRRVIVDGVFKFDDQKKCGKTVNQWIADLKNTGGGTVEMERVRKPPRGHFMVITLQEPGMTKLLIDYINKNNLQNKKGGKLIARLATSDEDDDRKRKRDEVDNDNNNNRDRNKRQNIDQQVQEARRPVTDDELRDKLTPLWRLTTEEQHLQKLREMIKQCAMKIVKEINARFRLIQKEAKRDRRPKVPLYDWVSRKRCIEMEKVVAVPSPLRNKSEFNFGYRYLFDSSDSPSSAEHKTQESDTTTGTTVRKVPAVGSMATGWAGGVCKPHCCANIPPEVCSIVDLVDEFLLKSPLPPYDSKPHTGFWRTLTIRSSRRTAEFMIVVTHTPASGGIGDESDNFSQQDIDAEKERLVTLLTQSTFDVPDLPDQAPLKVASIFFQEFDGVSAPSADHPVQHAYGKTSLQEKLGKCTFQISPGAFFQVNTQGAEILYQLVVDKVREVSKDPKDTLLFDVCCGTGTIGLTCMKEGVVGRVVGIDISEAAIADAKKNAELNGFGDDGSSSENACTRFIAARAEHVMLKEIGRAKHSSNHKFVAVVDPARDGLHTDVIKALRSNERIGRIVYVSCNPTGSLVRDAALLCAPPTKRYNGTAFRVQSATPVDMFPLTTHCECVMTFDRVTEADIKGGAVVPEKATDEKPQASEEKAQSSTQEETKPSTT